MVSNEPSTKQPMEVLRDPWRCMPPREQQTSLHWPGKVHEAKSDILDSYLNVLVLDLNVVNLNNVTMCVHTFTMCVHTFTMCVYTFTMCVYTFTSLTQRHVWCSYKMIWCHYVALHHFLYHYVWNWYRKTNEIHFPYEHAIASLPRLSMQTGINYLWLNHIH